VLSAGFLWGLGKGGKSHLLFKALKEVTFAFQGLEMIGNLNTSLYQNINL
jgi:hypothetical protein